MDKIKSTPRMFMCVLTITNDSSKFLKSTIWNKFLWKTKHSVKCKFCSDCSLSKENLINYIEILNKIRASGLYNFQDCRIPVFSKLNISYIRQTLLNYSD